MTCAVERDDMRWWRTLAVSALLMGVGFTSCTDGSDGGDSSFDESPPSVVLSAQHIAETAADECGPDGRDELHADAGTQDAARASRWYANRLEPQWQLLAEEACYLALVNADL